MYLLHCASIISLASQVPAEKKFAYNLGLMTFPTYQVSPHRGEYSSRLSALQGMNSLCASSLTWPAHLIYIYERKEKKCSGCKLVGQITEEERCFNEFICMEMHYYGGFWCSWWMASLVNIEVGCRIWKLKSFTCSLMLFKWSIKTAVLMRY